MGKKGAVFEELSVSQTVDETTIKGGRGCGFRKTGRGAQERTEERKTNGGEEGIYASE